MADEKNYRMPMPQKMGERGSAGSVGHQRADIRRSGNMPNVKTRGLVDQHGKAADGMTLQPEPHDSPTMPAEQNGFAPLNGDLPKKDDAQTAQTHADPVAHESEPAETIPTTATAPDRDSKTTPTVEGVENEPTGSVSEARYPAQIEEAHPVGFPSD
jgi:hypothetical protein